MAECEIYEPFQINITDDPSKSGTIFTFRQKLPKNYFTFEKTLFYYSQGGPPHQLGGLINVGYNCYINVVIQCLAYTPGFPQFCLSMPNVIYQNNSTSAFFLDSFARIYTQLSENRSISPTWFLTDSGLLSETFKKPIQQDAHEYLLWMIDVFENECSNSLQDPHENSIISHFFSGELKTEIVCHDCGNKIIRSTKFHDIQIPISEYPDLSTALQSIASSEPSTICCECEHCHRIVNISKTTNFENFPLILIITQLRFDSSCKKIEDFFSFQKELTINGDLHYELYAMILHDGRLISHGHFVAYVKDASGEWFKADDTTVYRLNDDAVMSSCPYVLFYRRIIE